MRLEEDSHSQRARRHRRCLNKTEVKLVPRGAGIAPGFAGVCSLAAVCARMCRSILRGELEVSVPFAIFFATVPRREYLLRGIVT